MSNFINRTFKDITDSASFPNFAKYSLRFLKLQVSHSSIAFSLPQIKWRRKGEPTKVTYKARVKNGDKNPIPKIIMAQLDKTH